MSRNTSIASINSLTGIFWRMSVLTVLSLMALASIQSNAHAVPMQAPACDSGIGPFPCRQPGNDSGVGGEANVELGIQNRTGIFMDIMAVTADVINAPADFTFNPQPINFVDSFDWTYSGSETLAYATLKAGDEFAIFDIFGLTAGTLTTDDVIENDQGNPRTISHVVFWKKVGVPEPATLGLLAVGLAGLGAAARRRRLYFRA